MPETDQRMMTPSLQLTLRTLHLLGLALAAVLLSSCASTSVKRTWKSPDLQQPVSKIAVITVEKRGSLRKGFENRLVDQLEKAGTPAIVTYDQFALDEIKKDKRAVADSFLTNGVGAVLILRLMDVDKSYRENQPGGERYAATITGFGTGYGYMGWYDCYSVGFANMSPTYGNAKQTVMLETSLHDLKTEKRLWSGLTKTVIKESTDRVAEMDPIVAKVIAAMRKDGAIR